MEHPLALQPPNHLYFAQHHSLRILGIVTRRCRRENGAIANTPLHSLTKSTMAAREWDTATCLLACLLQEATSLITAQDYSDECTG